MVPMFPVGLNVNVPLLPAATDSVPVPKPMVVAGATVIFAPVDWKEIPPEAPKETLELADVTVNVPVDALVVTVTRPVRETPAVVVDNVKLPPLYVVVPELVKPVALLRVKPDTPVMVIPVMVIATPPISIVPLVPEVNTTLSVVAGTPDGLQLFAVAHKPVPPPFVHVLIAMIMLPEQ